MGWNILGDLEHEPWTSTEPFASPRTRWTLHTDGRSYKLVHLQISWYILVHFSTYRVRIYLKPSTIWIYLARFLILDPHPNLQYLSGSTHCFGHIHASIIKTANSTWVSYPTLQRIRNIQLLNFVWHILTRHFPHEYMWQTPSLSSCSRTQALRRWPILSTCHILLSAMDFASLKKRQRYPKNRQNRQPIPHRLFFLSAIYTVWTYLRDTKGPCWILLILVNLCKIAKAPAYHPLPVHFASNIARGSPNLNNWPWGQCLLASLLAWSWAVLQNLEACALGPLKPKTAGKGSSKLPGGDDWL